MSELKDIIDRLLEKNGKFQIILIILLCLNSIQVGINHTITSFHAYVPSFFCRDDPETSCGTIINGTECPSGYTFDELDDKSVVVEWSLVCDRKLISALINTLYFVGVTFGALICGTLADQWGRKKLVLVCMYFHAFMSVGIYFTTSLELFAFLRILQGFFIQGLQNCTYTLMLEYCPSRHRTAAAVFWELNWAIGLGILGGVAYFVRDWRLLTLILILPTVLSLLYFWIIPESISWLYARGRYKEAFRLTHKVAKKNHDEDILEDCEKVTLSSDAITSKKDTDLNKFVNTNDGDDNVNLDENAGDRGDNSIRRRRSVEQGNEENLRIEKSGLIDVIRSRPLRKHLFIMIFVWFAVTLSYYGILYFLPSLAGQRHVNFLVGAGIEAAAYIVAYFVLSRFGRRIPMASYQYINSVLCIMMGILSYIEDRGPAGDWILIVIALIAKGLAVSSFCGMFIYCSELFPTVCRGLSLGLCGFAARCGSLLAPQLMILIYYAPKYVPMIIMAISIAITGTLTLFLPETLSSRLPNTIREANQLWNAK